MCLFFKQSEGSAGADDSNFGPKQGGEDSEKKVNQVAEREEETNFGRTKRQQVLKGFDGWNTMRQQVLYFA